MSDITPIGTRPQQRANNAAELREQVQALAAQVESLLPEVAALRERERLIEEENKQLRTGLRMVRAVAVETLKESGE